MLCPTCGRKPSERHYNARKWPMGTPYPPANCPSPIHDLADAGPELYEALLEAVVLLNNAHDSERLRQDRYSVADKGSAALALATPEAK